MIARFNLLLLAMAVIFVGCKKDTENPPPSHRIKSIISGNHVQNFIYDDQWRLIRWQSPDGKMEYEYNSTTVTVAEYTAQGNFQSQSIYTLGANGLATTSTTGTYKTDYVYNSDGQKIAGITTNTNAAPATTNQHISHFSNGNCDSITFASVSGYKIPAVYYDEYYTDKTEYLQSESRGLKFLGSFSKNLLKKIRMMNGPGYRVSTFTYEFDQQGRATKVITHIDGQPDSEVTYIWY